MKRGDGRRITGSRRRGPCRSEGGTAGEAAAAEVSMRDRAAGGVPAADAARERGGSGATAPDQTGIRSDADRRALLIRLRESQGGSRGEARRDGGCGAGVARVRCSRTRWRRRAVRMRAVSGLPTAPRRTPGRRRRERSRVRRRRPWGDVWSCSRSVSGRCRATAGDLAGGRVRGRCRGLADSWRCGRSRRRSSRPCCSGGCRDPAGSAARPDRTGRRPPVP